jgi:hypothetical protein
MLERGLPLAARPQNLCGDCKARSGTYNQGAEN